MSIKSFLKLVEIQTKVASMVPFLIGTIYALYRFNTFKIQNFFILFISVLAFDMVTTAINNYYDYKRANKKEGYNYEEHNAIVNYNLKENTVIFIIFMLLAIAILFGIILFINTDIVILILGIISFAIGILYSFGPIPISRTPLGEIFSGFFMGFIIIFVSTYVHVYDLGIISFIYREDILSINLNLVEILYIFLISIPTIVGIANIMLANNICDIEDDIENNRYTLPVYLGKRKALTIFKILYFIVYVNLILLIVLNILPIYAIVLLLTLIPVKKNIDIFYKKHTKKDTFSLSVMNFLMISVSYLFIFIVGYFI